MQQKPGLFQRMMSRPGAMNMALMGLGALTSKKSPQAQAYISGISQSLANQEAWNRGAPARDLKRRQVEAEIAAKEAQGRLYDAQAGAEGLGPGLWDGTGGSVNAMRIVSELGSRPWESLSDKEKTALQTAKAYLQRAQYVSTPSGMLPMAPMDLSFLDSPGAVTSPVEGGAGVAPTVNQQPPIGGTGYDFIGGKDPLKARDAETVVTTLNEADTYTDMIPLFDAIEQDMAVFPTGRLAELELSARSLGDVIGAGNPAVLAAGERLEKNINKMVSQNMEFLKGAMSEGEREFTKQFSLGMKTSVPGNRAYIQFLRGVAERASNKGALQRRYFRDNGNSLDGWEEHWQEYIKENPVPIPEVDIAADQDWDYDPATGEWKDNTTQ